MDFGTAEVSYLQKMIQVKYLVMSFPYSNAAYLWFLPSENIECFLTGLKELMHCAGAVPRKIWFDNLSAAVAKVKGRDRKLTELFRRFALHYGFQYEFCNVGQRRGKRKCRKQGRLHKEKLDGASTATHDLGGAQSGHEGKG